MLSTEEGWELYVAGAMDAQGFLQVLVGVHGEGMRASWPRILAGLVPRSQVLCQDIYRRGTDNE